MAITRYSTFDKTVDTIAERNAIVNKVNHMTVVVKDAIADPSAGAGKAIYRWDAVDDVWILVSKSTYETISFMTEEITINNGEVQLSNYPVDNKVWNAVILSGQLIYADLNLSSVTISNSKITNINPTYNGNTLRVTYAYGSIAVQINEAIEDKVDAALLNNIKTINGAEIIGTGNIVVEGVLPEMKTINSESILGTGDITISTAFADITSKPTTLSGYGITDAYTKNEVESKIVELSPPTDISMKADKVSTYTKTETDTLLADKMEVTALQTVSEDIIPSLNSTYNIGSAEKRWKGIYVDEAYLSTNTLYIGDTPVLGTDAENIVIKADVGQSITVQTKGLGVTNITSENEVSVSTAGTNADVVIQATGTNSKVKIAGANGIELSSVLNAQSDVNVSGNFTLSGNFIHNGSQFTVNATTVTTKDNIVVLNQGEVGSGVTAGKAGIQIDRGDAADYQLIFDESTDKFVIGQVGGTFETLSTREYVDAGLSTGLNLKVDKISGKGLSTEDYTTAEKTKLASIENNANNYILPVASSTVLGGVKAGTNISIDANGVISANDTSIAWSEITSKPTTLSGYGITDSIQSTLVSGTNIKTINGTSILGSGDIVTTQTTITGNAGTATKLQTARTINGVSFDGSANISVNTNNSEIIKFDSGTTEGTDLYTFNGSSTKTIDIKAGTNVTLTKAAGSITISANDTSVAWSEITSKPTTLSGYGITDSYTKTELGTVSEFNTSFDLAK